MAENVERRGTSDTLGDLRVAVARIETAVGFQTESLKAITNRLDITVLRDEFNTRSVTIDAHLSRVDHSLKDLQDAHSRQIGSSGAWRLVFSGALALLTIAVAVVGALKL